MRNVKEIEKAFREARIENEKLLMDGKIRYCDYAEIMLGFDYSFSAKLKAGWSKDEQIQFVNEHFENLQKDNEKIRKTMINQIENAEVI